MVRRSEQDEDRRARQVPPTRNPDTGATPALAAHDDLRPPTLAEIDKPEVETALEETIERFKADDPKELHKRIAQLERELNHRPIAETPEPIKVEVPILKLNEANLLSGAVEDMGEFVGPLVDITARIESIANTVRAAVTASGADFHAQIERLQNETPARTFPGTVSAPKSQTPRSQPPKPAPISDKTSDTTPDESASALSLNKSEKHMLDVFADRYPLKLTKPQVAHLAGHSRKSSTVGVYLAKLKRFGFVETVGSEFQITEAGFGYLDRETPAEAMSAHQVREMWRGALNEGERRFFDHLVSVYPKGVTKTELGEAAGHSLKSSTIGVYIALLKRNGLAVQEGDLLFASADLFDEGAAA